MAIAEDIEEVLLSMRNDRQRVVYMRFFKTGKGEYGEGDHFLGIRNPQVRMVVKEVWKDTSIEQAVRLVHSVWHEVRLCGLLVMTKKMEKAVRLIDDDEMKHIFQTYLSLHPYVNNWDLVDLSATIIAGFWEVNHPEDTILDQWISAPDSTLWQRRIAMVSTWRLAREGRYHQLVYRAECLIDSKEDLLHKAAGWMLREMGKLGGKMVLDDFLEANVTRMPSVMLRYAIERFSDEERGYWMQIRSSASARKSLS